MQYSCRTPAQCRTYKLLSHASWMRNSARIVPSQEKCWPMRGHRTISRSLDPDNASVLVCGGSGVAMHTTRKLKDMGAWVWMMQRTDKLRGEIEGIMALWAQGDALDRGSVKKVMQDIDDVDAVVSSVGGGISDPTPDSTGNINIIEEAMAAGVKKFVLVTSVGTGDSKDAPPEEVYKALKPVLIEKEKAENLLMEQNQMTWVIIRPGGLTNDAPTGNWFVTEERGVCGAISREDVAAVIAKALFTDKLDNKIVAALDADRVITEVEYQKITL